MQSPTNWSGFSLSLLTKGSLLYYLGFLHLPENCGALLASRKHSLEKAAWCCLLHTPALLIFKLSTPTALNREAGPLDCFPVGLKASEAAFHTLILSCPDWIESYVQRKENISLISALVYIPVYSLFLNISFETLWNNIATQLEHDRLYKSASPHVKQILFILVYKISRIWKFKYTEKLFRPFIRKYGQK